jgi:hypothetical protein
MNVHTYLKFPLLLLLFARISPLFGQGFDLGSWNIINYQYILDDKWSVFGEAQLRSLKFYNQFHYYEYKGGFSYRLRPEMTLSLAAGDYDTYAEGGNFVVPKNNDEFRLWPQLVLMQRLGKWRIEQRYRAEMRFTSVGYRNRFRYRLGLNIPLSKKTDTDPVLRLSVANELFFTDREPYFERNRFLIAMNYRVHPAVTLLLGYLHQFDYKINDETGRDFLQIGFYFESRGKGKGTSSPQPGILDD